MTDIIGILVFGAGLPLLAGICLYGLLCLFHLGKFLLVKWSVAPARSAPPVLAIQPVRRTSRVYTTGPITKPIQVTFK